MGSADRVRVLIVEDDPTFARVLQHLLESDPVFEVVGHASNGDEGFTMAIALRPAIVTMDLEMPVRDGVEATRMITEFVRGVRVVVVSASPRRDADALAAGAIANVPKYDVGEALLPLLRSLATSA